MKPDSEPAGTLDERAIPWIGVIDLQAGKAVHGIAGNRDQYRNVKQFDGAKTQDHAINGQATALIDCYWREGLRQFYVADLDALQGSPIQRTSIEAIQERLRLQTVNACSQTPLERQPVSATLWLDLGLNHDRIKRDADWLCQLRDMPQQATAKAKLNVRFILATEAAQTLDCLTELAERLGPAHVALGLDYKQGRPLGMPNHEQHWCQRANQLGVRHLIALDLAAVGTGDFSLTIALLQRLRERWPQGEIITGGGIRDDLDARRLLQLGAAGLLVASRFVR
ncbi:MAG: hypothetical protein CBB71_17900 [Rhodopirellula sp. TMED11]|nr:MAG: hypothetical protein CBB71_17900 [Rhodopirellula sp. TMED11]